MKIFLKFKNSKTLYNLKKNVFRFFPNVLSAIQNEFDRLRETKIRKVCVYFGQGYGTYGGFVDFGRFQLTTVNK